MIYFIPVIVIIAVIAVFSVQNADPVAITFLHWSFQASLAIVVFLSVLSGILIAAIMSIPGRIRRMSESRASQKAGNEGQGPD